ncbi:alpha-D-ribose 1-methylphosphonate 5-triphosphate diphosphatase [Phytoactinopolyspora halotolerans]|uniref:Alpha-D-ribose 1-methylphosphonate 5-triphosphate diphosphatase n=1 Tax=Phytoactinopolyspora halotolerans TaxID=1981512 RepID=A0A6L9S698_9ACTN|nr:alpha-D-ribose 1-methylphosphonate 5-triphosphate diphosphatase [Phytoactinopolyspora halotolerans]NEE00493.1 alpha-D-ribose 1-methylphosphonate 5-triphosphate diphosphatase [Phytoactinopolyspora halotolerans]
MGLESRHAAHAPGRFVLGHVRAVVGGRIVDDARLVVRDGVIEEVGPHPAGRGADVDGAGLLCLPGLVDVHNDRLVRACRPRPGASVPADLAFQAVEAELLGAGITTAYHGVAFQARSAVGIPIESPTAGAVYETIQAATTGGAGHGAPPRMDHRILHRLDIRCPSGVAELAGRLDPAREAWPPPLISHEDHTPGQGQYADPGTMRRWLVEAEEMSAEQAASHVERLRVERDTQLHTRDAALDWLGGLAGRGRIRLAGHDPATEDEVDALVRRHGSVAEFPTTPEAAERARELGLHVVAGAPNVVLGRSHSGNVSAARLVEAGWVTALTSDYLPSALLAAGTELVRNGLATLPAAVALLTAGPADAAGLNDRGRLAPGLRADVVLADVSGRWPVVRCALPAAIP